LSAVAAGSSIWVRRCRDAAQGDRSRVPYHFVRLMDTKQVALSAHIDVRTMGNIHSG
jgi:hypothetical protein